MVLLSINDADVRMFVPLSTVTVAKPQSTSGTPARFLNGSGGQYARLCYSLPDPDRIGEGIRRLAAVIETEMQLRDDFGPMSAS